MRKSKKRKKKRTIITLIQLLKLPMTDIFPNRALQLYSAIMFLQAYDICWNFYGLISVSNFIGLVIVSNFCWSNIIAIGPTPA